MEILELIYRYLVSDDWPHYSSTSTQLSKSLRLELLSVVGTFFIYHVHLSHWPIMDIVTQVLEKQAKELSSYKPITVEKHLELELDLGALLAIDKNDLDAKALK